MTMCEFFNPPLEDEESIKAAGLTIEEAHEIAKQFEGMECPEEGTVPVVDGLGKEHFVCNGHAQEIAMMAMLREAGII